VNTRKEIHMASSSTSSSGGIGFVGLLTIVFIVLKLIHKIGWPWLWVVSPVWISAGLAVVVVLLFLAGAAIVSVFKR
jgi:hypothetical protein